MATGRTQVPAALKRAAMVTLSPFPKCERNNFPFSLGTKQFCVCEEGGAISERRPYSSMLQTLQGFLRDHVLLIQLLASLLLLFLCSIPPLLQEEAPHVFLDSDFYSFSQMRETSLLGNFLLTVPWMSE